MLNGDASSKTKQTAPKSGTLTHYFWIFDAGTDLLLHFLLVCLLLMARVMLFWKYDVITNCLNAGNHEIEFWSN